MELQISRGVHPEVPTTNAVHAATAAPWRGVPQAGVAEGEPSRGRAPDVGPRSHDAGDTAQVRGVASGGVHQIKGKSAIHLARVYGERKRNFVGQHFWARGYFVSTVGRDEAVIREYIKNQEKEEERPDQLGLWRRAATDQVAPAMRGRVSDPFQPL